MYYAEFLLGVGGLCAMVYAVQLNRTKTHDKVLYRFCQVRRDIMTLFRTKGFEISKHDYVALRQILDVVSTTIHHFNDCKATIFNIRTLARLSGEYRASEAEMKKFLPSCPEGRKIVDAYRSAMMKAFLSYTPFIKSEVALRFFLYVMAILYSTMGKMGIEKVRETSENLFWIKKKFNDLHA